MFLDYVLKLIPDWLLPLLFGAFLWWGAHFLFLSKTIVTNYALLDCPAKHHLYCTCAASYIHGSDKVAVSLWTASFGLISLNNNDEIHNVRSQITKSGVYSDEAIERRYNCDHGIAINRYSRG